MNIDIETVMAALFARLQAAAAIAFTASATEGSTTLTAATSTAALFPGLPVFGPGLAPGMTIAAVDSGSKTVTLSASPSVGGVAGFSTGFLTTGRRVRHWGEVKAQPALFLRRTGMIDETHHDNFFTITTIECEAWIYCNAGQDPDVAPDAALTRLEQLVRAAFAPDSDYGDPRFTLSGLVHWCRLEGKSEIAPGDQAGQAIARMSIRITLP